jgi:hypothetical protein
MEREGERGREREGERERENVREMGKRDSCAGATTAEWA